MRETHPEVPKRALVMFCGPGGPHTRPNGLPNRNFASNPENVRVRSTACWTTYDPTVVQCFYLVPRNHKFVRRILWKDDGGWDFDMFYILNKISGRFEYLFGMKWFKKMVAWHAKRARNFGSCGFKKSTVLYIQHLTTFSISLLSAGVPKLS